MENLVKDVRYAARSLWKHPGFTVTAVLTLMLGTGGTTAMFSFVNAVLLRPLPVERPAELVSLSVRPLNGAPERYFSYPDYRTVKGEGTAFTGMGAFGLQPFSIGVGESAVTTVGAFASGNYFQVLGIRPALGRFFAADDDRPGSAPTVVLSHDYWQRRLQGDPAVIGSTVHINAQPATVIGVAPRNFYGTISLIGTEFWVPVSAYAQFFPGHALERPSRWLQVFGRLAPDVEPTRAAASLEAVARQLNQTGNPQGVRIQGVSVEPLQGMVGDARRGAMAVSTLLLIAAMLVLAIASINVAGMLLARASARRSDIAIRLALGAERGQVLRHLLTESVLLWLLGGLCGTLLSVWLVRLLPAMVPVQQEFPMQLGLDMGLDARVLGFTLGVSLLTGLAFGLSPALQSLRVDLVSGLKDRAGAGQQGRSRSILVVAQVAASLLLLAVTGLFLRAVQHAHTFDPGFDPDNVAVATLDLHVHGHSQARGQEFFHNLVGRLQARPDVQAVTLSSDIPLGGSHSSIATHVPGRSDDLPAGERNIGYSVVTPGYFRTLSIGLIRGREFTATDRAGTSAVAIVSQTMAERYWGKDDPIGRTIEIGSRPVQVVGIADDVQSQAMGQPPEPFLYLPFEQRYASRMNVLVRTSGAATRVVGEEVRMLDPSLPLTSAMPLRALIVSLMPQRIIATLLGGLGLFGLLLAAVGIYGVTAFAAVQRSREIAVRMAMGAHVGDILRLVLGNGLRLVGLGVAIGLVATLLAAGTLNDALAGRSAVDPVVFGMVVLVMLAVTALACFLPAHRASTVDPMLVLRGE